MKVLFVARTYPPTIGGMQRFCVDFYQNYSKIDKIDLVANTKGNLGLPLFVIRLLYVLALSSHHYDVVHFSDAVLAPMSAIVRVFSRAKISFTVHGLDIVYSRFGYQHLILPALQKADKVIAVSQFTLEQCRERGVPVEKLSVIPNCITPDYSNASSNTETPDPISKFQLDILGKKILLTVGRLIKRKGHLWFLSNVFIKLPHHFIYIIAGAGPEFGALEREIEALGLSQRVYLLGSVTESDKLSLLKLSDLFIMPNIKVEGDQEGFGIAVLEAGSLGLPVIAANLEGITDAVVNGESGHLIGEKDADGFIGAILHADFDSALVKEVVTKRYDCENIARAYHAAFESIAAKI